MTTLTPIAEVILRGRAFAQGLASDHSSTFDQDERLEGEDAE